MRPILALLTLIILLISCNRQEALAPQPPQAPNLVEIDGGPAVAGEILVKYRAGLSTASLEPLAGTIELASFGDGDWGTLALVKVPEGGELDYARRYAARGAVAYAEPNYWIPSPQPEMMNLQLESALSPQQLPGPVTDPYFVEVPPGNAFDVTGVDGTEYVDETYLWGIHRVRAPEAWDAGYTGEGVVVAVIDTGVDLTHPDLAPNLWTNPNPDSELCPGLHGYDFVDDDGDPTDTNGHGTHVAGTVAAAANNVGVVGVAPQARIMALRGLGYRGGTTYALVRALKYAADCGAQLSNNSWGGTFRHGIRAFEDVLRYGTQLGHTYVFAAGNDYLPANPPAVPPLLSTVIRGVISVGATSNYNDRMVFSSAGDWVTVAAPGGTILSTFPVDLLEPAEPYFFTQGTSMAAPHVSGVVALLYQANPEITPEEVRNVLEATANAELTAQASRPDYDDAPIPGQFGYGLVDAAAAVEHVLNPPHQHGLED